MTNRIRIGVLGCAKIARRSVLPAIKALQDDFELVAVASRDKLKAEEFAREFGCHAIHGYEEIVARKDIDALYLPLPTGLHHEWTSKAIAVGKHMYVEKSFASTALQASSLVAAAAACNLALMEGYMFLYHRQHAQVRAMIDNGDLGELRHFHGCFGFPPFPPGDFRYDEQIGGGVLLDTAGYPLRAARLFCGDSMMVKAATLARDPRKGTSLWGSAFLSDERGLGASLAFGFDNSYSCRYEIWGSRGRITAERAFTPGPSFSPRLLFESSGKTRTIDVVPDNHFVGALREFRKAIEDATTRAEHYAQITRQSATLDEIRRLADTAA